MITSAGQKIGSNGDVNTGRGFPMDLWRGRETASNFNNIGGELFCFSGVFQSGEEYCAAGEGKHHRGQFGSKDAAVVATMAHFHLKRRTAAQPTCDCLFSLKKCQSVRSQVCCSSSCFCCFQPPTTTTHSHSLRFFSPLSIAARSKRRRWKNLNISGVERGLHFTPPV